MGKNRFRRKNKSPVNDNKNSQHIIRNNKTGFKGSLYMGQNLAQSGLISHADTIFTLKLSCLQT